jgi:hypothetical protein
LPVVWGGLPVVCGQLSVVSCPLLHVAECNRRFTSCNSLRRASTDNGKADIGPLAADN